MVKTTEDKELADNNLEIAQKVAKKLGFIKCIGSYMWWSNTMAGFEGLEVFSWSTLGLMVEKAEDMGWNFSCEVLYGDSLIRFKPRVGHKSFGLYQTPPFYIKEHGHIKACALAFLKIPLEIPLKIPSESKTCARCGQDIIVSYCVVGDIFDPDAKFCSKDCRELWKEEREDTR